MTDPPQDGLVADEATILGWIQTVYAAGIRRPGYPADRFAESYCADQFRAFGLEHVRLEPVRLPYWEPRSASLRVHAAGAALELPCFPLPHAAASAYRRPGRPSRAAAVTASTASTIRAAASTARFRCCPSGRSSRT